MIWNDHHQLEGQHAFLGASSPYWLDWDENLFEARFRSKYATEIGTAVHNLAKKLILAGIKISYQDRHLIDLEMYSAGIPINVYDPDDILKTLVPYVNDAIGFQMTPEVLLYYSIDCFGTTDAIKYDASKHTLRIHDLKTGKIAAKMKQLMVYAVLFCLEYKVNPRSLERVDLCIYQGEDIISYNPTSEELVDIMEKTIQRAYIVAQIRERTC